MTFLQVSLRSLINYLRKLPMMTFFNVYPNLFYWYFYFIHLIVLFINFWRYNIENHQFTGPCIDLDKKEDEDWFALFILFYLVMESHLNAHLATKSPNFLFFRWDKKASLRVIAAFSVFPLIFWLKLSSSLNLWEFLISLKTSIIFNFDWDSKRSSLNFLMV